LLKDVYIISRFFDKAKFRKTPSHDGVFPDEEEISGKNL
jgi:hypothetical protein